MAQLIQPVVSICIPTYNRCEYLDKTLESITAQDIFNNTGDIEIVVSDNCSDDSTQSVVMKYVERFNGKIKYHRNHEPVPAGENQYMALSLGRGIFLKLNNDTLQTKAGMLKLFLECIRSNVAAKPILFFANGTARQFRKTAGFINFEQFIGSTSYFITWIAAFGIWKEDFLRITDYNRLSHLLIPQVDVILNQFEWKQNSVVDNHTYFTSIEPEKKGGYDIIDVFVINYLGLLEKQIEHGMLSRKKFNLEKRRLLTRFIIPWIIRIRCEPQRFSFEIDNWENKMKGQYSEYGILYAKIMSFTGALRKRSKKAIISIIKPVPDKS